jgi:multisubunit Na+/H+ antiporter MnhB subunit
LTSFARPDLALAALMVLAAVTAVAALLAGQRRLRRLGLRRDQARQFLLGAGTRLAGLIGLLVAVYASLRR